MKKSIYLAIPKAHHTKLSKFSEIVRMLLGSDMEYFFHNIYSDYNESLLRRSDIVIAFIPENGVIGIGVYDQIYSKPGSTFIYFEADNRFVPFATCNVKALNVNDAATWAKVSLGVSSTGVKLSYKNSCTSYESNAMKVMVGIENEYKTTVRSSVRKTSSRRRLLL